MNRWSFHPEAVLDLEEIWDFIAEDSIDAADRVVAEILLCVENLTPFPDQGHRRRDLTSCPLRFVVVHQYLIAYAPDEMWVIAVMHGRRNPRVMAAILRGRE
jgi:plasmid stabilization system protein ParE